MKIEEVKISIGVDGKIQLETSGFSGDACLEATADIEKLLGSNVIRRERTSETYDQPPIRTAEKIKIHR